MNSVPWVLFSSCFNRFYHASWDTSEVMCKGLLKSKLDMTRCLISRHIVVLLGDEWCCQLLSLYFLVVDTLLPLYKFTLDKTPLNSWHTLLEWREKDPILPTPFKCFQGEKAPIQLLEVEEVLWSTLVRYLSSDTGMYEKERACV